MKKHLIWLSSLLLILAGCTQPNASKPASTAKKEEKTFHLYIADLNHEVSDGNTLYSWGFGLWDPVKNKPAAPPTIPGPEIRVKEGDHVKIVLHNKQKEPHTIHFHGVDNSFAGDGTPGISQREVEEGQTFTYEFDAVKAGTYFYHCHVEPDRHPEMGLYGAFIVEPKQKMKMDGEFTLLLAERDPKLSLAESAEAGHFPGTAAEHMHLDGDYDTLNRQPTFFTINGKADPSIPAIKVKKGGTYLIRLINAGSDVHSIHFHGHHVQVIASDGRSLPKNAVKDTITIGPGERYDVLLTANNPGAWPIHCHMGPHGTHGMHMLMIYEGFEQIGENQHQQHLNRMLHEIAEMEEFLYTKKYDQIKVELAELTEHYEQIKGKIQEHDPKLAAEIEKIGADLAKQLLGKPDHNKVSSLILQLKEKMNQAKEGIGGHSH